MTKMSDFSENFFSQNGEDGILHEILRRFSSSRQELTEYFVEFGAWDGIKFSNTWNLALKSAWRGLYIEADPHKFQELVHNCASLEGRVVGINQYVRSGGEREKKKGGGNSLDEILTVHHVPEDFGVLSVDIDGNDFHVWKSLKRFNPTVVIVEFNFTIPETVNYVQEDNARINIGNSYLAFMGLAKEKGYFLAGATNTNLIFIRDVYKFMFDDLEKVEVPFLKPVYVWSGYDGSLQMSDTFTLQWHPIYVLNGGLQILPRLIRKYPSSYNFLDKIFFEIVKIRWRITNRLLKAKVD